MNILIREAQNRLITLAGHICRVVSDEQVDEITIEHLMGVFSEYDGAEVDDVVYALVNAGVLVTKQDGDSWYFYPAPREGGLVEDIANLRGRIDKMDRALAPVLATIAPESYGLVSDALVTLRRAEQSLETLQKEL